MRSLEITIESAEGLHARPAHSFCDLANKFESDIQVRNVTTETSFGNAKSTLMVLALRVIQGLEVKITTSGSDERIVQQSCER